MDIETLSDEWISAQIHGKKGQRFNHWSVDYVLELHLDKKFAELWNFIKATYPKEIPDSVFGNLAAGATEDFLVGAGEEYFDEISKLASEDSKFKHLLGGVWQNDMSDEFWSRICQLREKSW